MKRSFALLSACLGFVWVGCSDRRTGNPIEASRVTALPTSEPIEYRTAGIETRPALRIPERGTLDFPLPPGPPQTLRTAVFDQSESVRAQRVFATVEGGAPSKRLAISILRIPASSIWQSWEFQIPELSQPARLRFRLSAREERPQGIFIARPTLTTANPKPSRVFVLVVIDTLRKDHVSAYGYSRKTTPNIDRFFADGWIWENCITNVPSTLPSHTTIFSSTLPSYHGVQERTETVPENLPLLAEILSGAGFRTLAVTNGGFLEPGWGFRRGFDIYHSSDDNIAMEIRDALNLIDAHRGEPIFLFLHTYQVHNYAPLLSSIRKRADPASDFGPRWQEYPMFNLQEQVDRYGVESVRRWLNARYDAALEDTDVAFHRLTAGLEQRGLLDKTAVLLTGDHGEEILDRQTSSGGAIANFGHGDPWLFDEDIRVPLMLRVPWWKEAPARLPGTVSLMAVAPTITQALGLPPPPSFQEKTLAVRSESPAPADRMLVTRAARFDSIAVRRGQWKLLRRSEAPFVGWADEARFGLLPPLECFDTAADPSEQHPVSCEQPQFEPLAEEAQREIAALYPGSLILRVIDGGVTGLKVSELQGTPQVFSFGELPGTRFWTKNGLLEGRFPVSKSHVWFAVQPAVSADAMSVTLFGANVTQLSTGVSLTDRRSDSWANLLWRKRGMIPRGNFVFTTRPTSMGNFVDSGRFYWMDTRKLRSLGYLTGGQTMTFPRRQEAGAPESSDGMISLNLVNEPPPSPPTHSGIRRLERLEPSRVVAGSKEATDGLVHIMVIGDELSPDDNVFIDGLLIHETFIDPHHIDAGVPPFFFDKPGTVVLTVRNPLDSSIDDLRGDLKIGASVTAHH